MTLTNDKNQVKGQLEKALESGRSDVTATEQSAARSGQHVHHIGGGQCVRIFDDVGDEFFQLVDQRGSRASAGVVCGQVDGRVERVLDGRRRALGALVQSVPFSDNVVFE